MQITTTKAIVTGAASGMGKYFALALARDGATVTACDVNADGLKALEAESGGKIFTTTADVSKEDSVAALVEFAHEKMGGLNALVNNAGILRDGLLARKDKTTGEVKTLSLGQWQQVIDINLTGPFLCTREFARKVIETGTKPAVVVNMSSIARYGNAGQSNYSAAKAGLVADTKLWGQELARYGIRTGAIAPGFVRTPILEAMKPEILEGLLKQVPVGRIGEPEDIFRAVKFIIECDYFTGRCIDVDGGMVL